MPSRRALARARRGSAITILVACLLVAATVAAAVTAYGAAARARHEELERRAVETRNVAAALSEQVVSTLSDASRLARVTRLDPVAFREGLEPRLGAGAIERIALLDLGGPTPEVLAAVGGAPQLVGRADRAAIDAARDGDGVVNAAREGIGFPSTIAYATAVDDHEGVYVWAEVSVADVVDGFFAARDDVYGALYVQPAVGEPLLLASNTDDPRRTLEPGSSGTVTRDVALGADGAGVLVVRARTRMLPAWADYAWLIALLVGLGLTAVVTLLVESLRRGRVRAEDAAAHDDLTGLASRGRFLARLDDSLATGEPVVVCVVDLDDFKTVNDARGHAAGDGVLQAVACRLEAAVGDAGLLARLGGDEFAVLAAGGVEDGAAIARRIGAALEEPVDAVAAGVHVRVRASTGVATGERPATPAAVLRDADLAMYGAKRAGGGGFTVFEPSYLVDANERLALLAALPEAVRGGAIGVHYQPIRRVADGGVVGFEVLARWSRDGRPVPPAVFIPLAHEAGLICELGELVARAALADLPALRHVAPGAQLFLNVSSRQLATRAHVERIGRLIEDAGLSPGDVVLELTETELAGEEVVGACRALHAAGLGLAVDDFGAGWSNLGYLRAMPVDLVKVDRSLLRGGDGPADAALLAGVASLLARLGVRTVCEGVETEAHARLVAEAGFELAQGYLLGRPAPLVGCVANIAAERRAPASS